MIAKKINTTKYRDWTTLYSNMTKEQVMAHEEAYGAKCSGPTFYGRYNSKTEMCVFFYYQKSRKHRGWFVTTYYFPLKDVVYAQQYSRHFTVVLR